MKRATVVGVAAVAMVVGIGGCGGKSSNAPSGPPVATINVRETEFKIRPAKTTIKKPGVVEFKVKNAGHAVHALEVEGPNGNDAVEVRTKEIKPGKSATLRADLKKPGKYEWYCPVDAHKGKGMKGKITVRGA